MAELEELQCNPARSARGTVLEASLDKKAGAVSSLLVQAGTLRVGDAVQAGSSYGKVPVCVAGLHRGLRAAGFASRRCCIAWPCCCPSRCTPANASRVSAHARTHPLPCG